MTQGQEKTAMTASEKRKLTAEKKKKENLILKKYELVSQEMPVDWVKNKENAVEVLKTIHRDILGLDKAGGMRPMSDFMRFMSIASQAGLNPFLNEIYGLYFYDNSIKSEKLTVITGINGFRKAAALDTTAPMRYVGSSEPEIEMKEIAPEWANDGEEVPNKAIVKIYGMNPVTGEPTVVATGLAYWDEYVKMVDEYEYIDGKKQKTGNIVPNSNWRNKKIIMLKKCAEADGLRKAYPNKLNAIYERAEVERYEVPAKEIKDNDDLIAERIREQLEARRKDGGVFAQEAEIVNA